MKRTYIYLAYLVALYLLVIGQIALATQQPPNARLKKEIEEIIDEKSNMLIRVSDKIWEYAEIALMEHKSSKLLEDILESEGFVVEKDIAGLSTAFIATSLFSKR